MEAEFHTYGLRGFVTALVTDGAPF